jgi:hypothetical protein
VFTATFFSVPPAAVTVIPFDGSAPLAPFPGVIVTTGPADEGEAVAEAPPARAPADAVPPFAAACTVEVPLPVQAVTAAASAAQAARAQNDLIALISTLYLWCGMHC